MQIALLGATGKAGGAVLHEALGRGHSVRAVVRSAERLDVRHQRLEVIPGGFEDSAVLDRAFAGADAVITAVGVTSRARPTLLVDSVTSIRAGMRRAGVSRLVIVQGVHMTLPGDPRNVGLLLIKGLLGLTMRPLVADGRRLAALVSEDDAAWTVIRMPRLTVGPASSEAHAGALRVGPQRHVTSGDLALLALHCVEAGVWVRAMPMIVSGSARPAGRVEAVPPRASAPVDRPDAGGDATAAQTSVAAS